MTDWAMDRRAFLEHVTVSCGVLVAPLGLPALAPGVSRPAGPAPFELEEATIAGLQAASSRGSTPRARS